ncbi:MAG: LysR family transcriptional regulator [Pseudomonadota bacterium]
MKLISMKEEILRNLQRADLNALITLSVLLQLRSTTAAAQRLARTQSAVSHTLKKLRVVFDDELLIKDGRSFELTSRARALQPLLEKTLAEINTLITEPDGFSPQSSVREFRIAGPNFYTGVIADLSGRIRRISDDLSILFEAPVKRSFEQLLENQLDMVIAPTRSRPPAGVKQEAYESIGWVVYASINHPLTNRTITRQWTRWPHVQVVTGNTARSPVDDALASLGLQRRVSLRVPDFVSAMAMVGADQRLLFTAPHRPLQRLAGVMQLKSLKCPIDLPRIPMSIYTSMVRSQMQDINWLRRQLVQLIR